jgi:hypothetical protein
MEDELISLWKASKLLPRNSQGRAIHIHTIRRWIAKGVKRNGQFVRLRAKRIGARLFTSGAWIDEFSARCSGAQPDELEDVPMHGISISQEQAERFLILEGVYGAHARRKLLGLPPRDGERR